ncbi:MAG: DNA replication/repair protein RecF [Pseudomonadota bacterium]|nr:DNA replication/repair protein RecF [Pseudomonadota bacterium]
MPLVSLGSRTFRCFQHLDVELSEQWNCVFGQNGSGKTSFLEAIAVLGHGRSFRTNLRKPLVKAGASGFQVFGQVTCGPGRAWPMGLSWTTSQGVEARIGGQPARSIGELAHRLPVQVLHSRSHELVSGGPAERRRYLDWSVFHVEHTSHAAWRRFRGALDQRNACLRRGGRPSEIRVWDHSLVEAGELIDRWRRQQLAELQPKIESLVAHLANIGSLTLRYRSGWPDGQSLGEAISNGIAVDVRYGQTRSGPHRADLDILVDGRPAAERLSRGQQKLLSAALVFAQVATAREVNQCTPLLLVDDLSSELDEEGVIRLTAAMGQLGAQIVVSSLRRDLHPPAEIDTTRWFHVEHGHVKAMI